LSNAIAAEAATRLSEITVERLRIDAILAGSTVDLDQLTELVNAYSNADSAMLTQITALQTSVANIIFDLGQTNTKLDTALVTAVPCGFPSGTYLYNGNSVITIVNNGTTLTATSTTETWGTTSGPLTATGATLWGNITGTWNESTQSITWSNGTVYVYTPGYVAPPSASINQYSYSTLLPTVHDATAQAAMSFVSDEGELLSALTGSGVVFVYYQVNGDSSFIYFGEQVDTTPVAYGYPADFNNTNFASLPSGHENLTPSTGV